MPKIFPFYHALDFFFFWSPVFGPHYQFQQQQQPRLPLHLVNSPPHSIIAVSFVLVAFRVLDLV
jgi:hypothetical protein